MSVPLRSVIEAPADKKSSVGVKIRFSSNVGCRRQRCLLSYAAPLNSKLYSLHSTLISDGVTVNRVGRDSIRGREAGPWPMGKLKVTG